MNWQDLLNNPLIQALITSLIAAGVLRLTAEGLAVYVSKIPFIGPFLAQLIRAAGGQLEKWLSERLPQKATIAVQATEEAYRNTTLPADERAKAKLDNAIERMRTLEPGLSRELAKSYIESALTEIRGAKLEQKALGGAGNAPAQ